ncbi:UbiA prenyltransferase family protein [Paractinoplanes lichenicola]|uniref:UbiA family prenyltransferase n=1 Tax=Paractinoplanes lichenicola TaxID=2802976 RepID=A0ABS1VXK3_9ACTN|nr:UbiA family prenyltransferase [Actinoplanes lichenicola]MBL7259234.1 UbiA family prenyltransferase [Actinoplanes lichenicola]
MTAATLVVAVSRPWFWPVSWVPAYLGLVLADRQLTPADLPRSLLALLVLGPLVWGAVLAQNDLHDLPSDRVNPRKATAPLVTGEVDPATLRRWYRWIAAAALVTALFVGPLFVLGVAGVLVLGWAYSAPPRRLKTRPGWDVTVNALVVGVVSPAAGWAITRDPAGFPWQFGVIGLLFAAAVYVPTTVTDLPSDAGAGDTTFAVRFGARTAYGLGLGLWVSALIVALICAAADTVVPRSTLVPQLVTVPLLVAAYAILTWRPTIPRMAILSIFFAIPTAGFALAIT